MRSFQNGHPLDPVPGVVVLQLRSIDRSAREEARYLDQLPQLLEAGVTHPLIIVSAFVLDFLCEDRCGNLRRDQAGPGAGLRAAARSGDLLDLGHP